MVSDPEINQVRKNAAIYNFSVSYMNGLTQIFFEDPNLVFGGSFKVELWRRML